ncbi:phage tail assembly chaperone [Pararhizobium sp.]|uniref:phage tail assembly chaperone n=1 Tax=Pararhizobium sp. TaxID=1977563 RepID=UPI00271EE44C|nr:hypothetical protein [Pararhizobium sp.]MDO9417036.1 hypothetical protein [Pararhizobium sp.]
MADKKINGRTFKFAPMLALEALVLQARLLRVVGKGISRLPEIFGGRTEGASVKDKAKADAAAIAALSDIFTQSEPAELANLIKDIVEKTSMLRPSGDYESVDLNADFSDSLGDIIPVVVWVLKEQFGSFFSGALANGGRALKGQA